MRKFLSAPYWIHLVIDTIIGQLIWWSISMILGTPAVIQSIIAGIVLIATIFATAWYLPKLQPGLLAKSTVPRQPKSNKTYPELINDGVLWQDGGNDSYGNINVSGPLCPNDYTPLTTKDWGDHITNSAKFGAVISDIPDNSGYFGYHKLVCPECKAEYTLGKTPKKLQDSHDEVYLRFKGKRTRKIRNMEP